MSVVKLDESTFDAIVNASVVPVLVDLTAEWCPPCRAMEPILEEVAIEWSGALVVASLDVDRHPAAAARVGAMSFPTMVVFVDGVEQARWVGARGKGRLLEDLAPFLPVSRRR